MALAKLFKVMDSNGQNWHIASPSFAEAERLMDEWEACEGGAEDNIQSLTKVEDLILGGNREESLFLDPGGNYQLLGFVQPAPPFSDWTLSNNMAMTGAALLSALDEVGSDFCVLSESAKAMMEALRAAIDKYEEIPF